MSSCLWVLALGIFLAACSARPTPTVAPILQTSHPPATSTAAPILPASTLVSVPSALPPVPSVDYCLPSEPQSLFPYARPEPGRAEILAALFPDARESLLENAAGELSVREVTLNAGDTAVDELGRVVALAAGVAVNLLDGAQVVFDGATPLTAPQLVVTFRLRPNLQWSDGVSLTAADSVFAFAVSRHPDAFNPRRALAERTAAYRALDDLTVEWAGLPGYIDPSYVRHFFAPLPRHIWEGLTPAQMAEDRNVLSWGPLMLSEWISGDHLTLTRNPYSAAVPEADPIIFRFAADGDCVTPPPVPASLTLVRLDYSLAPADERPPVLADINVRHAIALCLNRAAFTADVPATYAPRANLPPIPFDPAQGRALLAAPLTLTLAYGAEDEALALAIENQLEVNCGLSIEPRLLTRGELWGDWPDGVLFGRRFDLALSHWNVDESACALWMSKQIAEEANPGGANNTGYTNPEFDAACRAALTTLDPARAATFSAEAQQIFARDIPSLPLFFETPD